MPFCCSRCFEYDKAKLAAENDDIIRKIGLFLDVTIYSSRDDNFDDGTF